MAHPFPTTGSTLRLLLEHEGRTTVLPFLVTSVEREFDPMNRGAPREVPADGARGRLVAEGDCILRGVSVVGQRYDDEAREAGDNAVERGAVVELAHEPGNVHDAFAVVAVHDGERRGWLTRHASPAVVNALRRGLRVLGVVTATGTGDDSMPARKSSLNFAVDVYAVEPAPAKARKGPKAKGRSSSKAKPKARKAKGARQ